MTPHAYAAKVKKLKLLTPPEALTIDLFGSETFTWSEY
jgi:hypothetical protein